MQGDLAVWSPSLALVGTGVGHTGTVRGRYISRLLLLVGFVGAGPRLAIAQSQFLGSFGRTRKR